MIRALFVTFAWGSHFYPMVPFATALRSGGHEVLVASDPGFTGTITNAGLPAVPVGADIGIKTRASGAFAGFNPRNRDESEASAAVRQRAESYSQLATDSATAMAEDIYRLAEGWSPDVIVYEPTAIIAPGLAAHRGVPALRMLWGVDYLASVMRRRKEVLTELAREQSVDLDQAFGDVTVDPCPARLQIDWELRRQPIRYIPYNGPASLPHHLRTPPARPRILVTWGGSLRDLGLNDGILGPGIVRALARQSQYDIVIATTEDQRPLYGHVPDNVIHIGPIAIHLVLPTCDAVIHQGGAGTTMTAMSAGVPQLVFPWVADGLINADRISQAGAGRGVPAADLDTSTLDHHVSSFLDNLAEHRGAAARLRDEHQAHPTPTQLVTEFQRQHEDRTGLWALT